MHPAHTAVDRRGRAGDGGFERRAEEQDRHAVLVHGEDGIAVERSPARDVDHPRPLSLRPLERERGCDPAPEELLGAPVAERGGCLVQRP